MTNLMTASPEATQNEAISECYNKGLLQVSGGHAIYFEESGNPDGLPIVNVHGGPGGHSKPHHRERYDLSKFRLIMFDQRNCGLSTPSPVDAPQSLNTNTPDALIADMEALRTHLGIEKWHVGGSSWGTTIALYYASKHAQHCASLTLRSLFLGQERDWNWLFEGAPIIAPLAWRNFMAELPELDKDADACVIGQIVADKIMSDDFDTALSYGRALLKLERSLELLTEPEEEDVTEDAAAKTTEQQQLELHAELKSGRVYAHYLKHHKFENGWHETDVVKQALQSVPITIIHGNCDLLCPLQGVYSFIDAHPHTALHIAKNAGHGVDLDGEIKQFMNEALKAL